MTFDHYKNRNLDTQSAGKGVLHTTGYPNDSLPVDWPFNVLPAVGRTDFDSLVSSYRVLWGEVSSPPEIPVAGMNGSDE